MKTIHTSTGIAAPAPVGSNPLEFDIWLGLILLAVPLGFILCMRLLKAREVARANAAVQRKRARQRASGFYSDLWRLHRSGDKQMGGSKFYI